MTEDPHNYQRWVNIYQPFSISARINPYQPIIPKKVYLKPINQIQPMYPYPPKKVRRRNGRLMTFRKAAEALDGLSLAPGSEARQARKALIERIEWLDGDDDWFWLSIFWGKRKKQGVKFDGESMNINAKC